ncbi:MAG: phosphopyruvate hydratase [Candidatus Andersenbacteria bacterium]|nr:phosphopyruvate hydratase [Candidatus Andersenbacteria bacterium]
MNKIKKIQAREILDSRGNPTVEVEVVLENKIKAVAAVPSGASTGEFEALELRDGDKSKYGSKGVLKACENVNKKIAKALTGQPVTAQKKIDKIMLDLDGTENKSNLGANAILGVSLACARAGAIATNKPLYKYISTNYELRITNYKLPTPMFNIINGGKHADSGLSIQEFMIVPKGIKTVKEKIRAGSEIFQNLKSILSSKGYATGVGDEGGFAPKLDSHTQSFDLISDAIDKANYKLGKQIFIAIDAAANSFFSLDDNKYILRPENISLDYQRLIALYSEWIKKYPLFSIEDGLNEEDWDEWKEMKEKLISENKNLMIVADDLTVTNTKRLQKAIKNNCANAIIIKPNQIGSLSETIECVKMAQEAKWKVIVSHRSGETCDDFIADLAVAVGADFLKAGSLSRGERLAKYNRLMEIENELR